MPHRIWVIQVVPHFGYVETNTSVGRVTFNPPNSEVIRAIYSLDSQHLLYGLRRRWRESALKVVCGVMGEQKERGGGHAGPGRGADHGQSNLDGRLGVHRLVAHLRDDPHTPTPTRPPPHAAHKCTPNPHQPEQHGAGERDPPSNLHTRNSCAQL